MSAHLCEGKETVAVELYDLKSDPGCNVNVSGKPDNADAVRQLADNGTELMITVDCGITGIDEIKLAYELGMEVIVTGRITTFPGQSEVRARLADVADRVSFAVGSAGER